MESKKSLKTRLFESSVRPVGNQSIIIPHELYEV